MAEQDSRRTARYLFLFSHCDCVRTFPWITQSTNQLITGQRHRLELTVWFVPSIIENAIAVRPSSCPPRYATYCLYPLSPGIDNWFRPRSNVPTPRLAHVPNHTSLAPHWHCQSSNGDRDGWLCGTSLRYWFASVKVWDWVFAAAVSAIDWVSWNFFWLTIYFASFSSQDGIHVGRDAGCLGVCPKSCHEGGLRGTQLPLRFVFSDNLNEAETMKRLQGMNKNPLSKL